MSESTAPKVETSATMRVPSPFSPGDLRRFLEVVPPGAEVRITTQMGGTQRDPEATGYILWAKW